MKKKEKKKVWEIYELIWHDFQSMNWLVIQVNKTMYKRVSILPYVKKRKWKKIHVYLLICKKRNAGRINQKLNRVINMGWLWKGDRMESWNQIVRLRRSDSYLSMPFCIVMFHIPKKISKLNKNNKCTWLY